MFKLLSTAVLGATMTVTGANAAFACGGSCGCQPSCAAPAAACAAPAPAPVSNGSTAQPPVPPQTAGRQTYRSYSYEPSQQPVYSAPAMRRPASSYSRPFSADRKIRGLVN